MSPDEALSRLRSSFRHPSLNGTGTSTTITTETTSMNPIITSQIAAAQKIARDTAWACYTSADPKDLGVKVMQVGDRKVYQSIERKA